MDARGTIRSRILAELGRNVRTLRQSLHLSQERLALEAGVDRTYISQLERGQRNASVTTLCRVARALEVPPASLLEGIQWPDGEGGGEEKENGEEDGEVDGAHPR